MYELIYYSTAKKDLSKDEISHILKTAREFNSKNNITGCLLYHNHEFLQILEGEKSVIKKLMDNISSDERHYDLVILAEGETNKRLFDNWSMAYSEITDDKLKEINKELFVNNIVSLSKFAEKPTEASKLFWYMAKQIVTE